MTVSDQRHTSRPPQLQRCEKCNTWTVTPWVRCPVDPSHPLSLARVSGRATVYSWTVSHVPMSPVAHHAVPYTTLLVELEEGQRVLTHLIPQSALPQIGTPVLVHEVFGMDSEFVPNGALMSTPVQRGGSRFP